MCIQCAATATVAVGSASGIRAWLRLHPGSWLTPARMKVMTIGLLSLAVIVAGIGFGGTG